MKTCDVCDAPLGFVKFRYKGGYICKECYETASYNCTETVCQMDLSQLKERCSVKDIELHDNRNFDISGRIGNYILFDNCNKKFCIPNNRMILKEYKRPEIYNFGDIKSYNLTCIPEMPIYKLKELGENKDISKVILQSLSIDIELYSQKMPCKIHIIKTPVSTKSFAFRRSFEFTSRIIEMLDNNINLMRELIKQ